MNVLIVGQGYAGSMLAWFLIRNNVSVTVIDREDPFSSTRVSAGIMLPVTGRRLAKTHQADRILPFALDFYKEVEAATGTSFYTSKDVLQIFTSQSHRNEWYARSADPGMEAYVGEMISKTDVDPSVVNEFGGILLKKSGFVRPSFFLDAMRNYISEKGEYINHDLKPDEISYRDQSILWHGKNYDFEIFCEGYHSMHEQLFGYLPFNPAKGEILDFKASGLTDKNILVNSAYVVPLGDDHFRTGSTYEWVELNEVPTEKGRKTLEENLRSIINCNYTITGHKAGVRPAVKDRRPLLGFHPERKRLGIFNGLGTKGTMQGPLYAMQMAEYICKGTLPDEEVNIRRFESLYRAH
jgi:glycine/D-amino acid oxidase-like deaminating enzyme